MLLQSPSDSESMNRYLYIGMLSQRDLNQRIDQVDHTSNIIPTVRQDESPNVYNILSSTSTLTNGND
jgi:hypothetical protein